MYVEQVRRSIWCVTPLICAFSPASLSTRKRKLFVLMAVPREDGKMKPSGRTFSAAERQNSSSFSIETGSQTAPSLE
jgi:hypothetical protein